MPRAPIIIHLCHAKAYAAFLRRVPEADVKALELGQRFALLPSEWILRPVNGLLDPPERLAQARARYAFCPLCLQEMVRAARTAWIRSEWACATACPCRKGARPA